MSENLRNLHFYASSIAENIFKTSEWFLAIRKFIQAISSIKWLIVVICLILKMELAESNCNLFFLTQLNILPPKVLLLKSNF
jgi:hypothetical protein